MSSLSRKIRKIAESRGSSEESESELSGNHRRLFPAQSETDQQIDELYLKQRMKVSAIVELEIDDEKNTQDIDDVLRPRAVPHGSQSEEERRGTVEERCYEGESDVYCGDAISMAF